MRPSRPFPLPGMLVRVADGQRWAVVPIDAVHDEGRMIEVLGKRYVLNRLTGEFVREGEPYWGSRLSFVTGPDAGAEQR